VIAVGGDQTYPSIKAFSAATGVYNGTLVRRSVSQSRWLASTSSVAELYGFDDNSMYSPQGSYINGDFIYIAESGNGRIKKVNYKTGQTIGWIGGLASSPTGGATGCSGAAAFGGAPGWCLGSLPNPNFMFFLGNQWINTNADGNMYQPMGLTGDGTYLYVTDQGLHRIQKFRISDGAYFGWIGRINTPPSGGATGCAGAAYGTFTPGWCLGGYPLNGNGDGHLTNPTGITYIAATNNIYVIDYNNHRVNSYNATTGAFNGWIGRIGSNPTGGCTYGNNGNGYAVSQSGWCTGGTPQYANNDRGGGFAFNVNRTGISTDGTTLFIANTQNFRIDKWSTGGVFLGATSTRFYEYNNTWTTTGTTLSNWAGTGNSYVKGLWVDTNFMYLVMQAEYYTSATIVTKVNLSTGSTVGWKGQILSAFPPSNGDAGCSGATGITPGWCQGGAPNYGYTLGGFSSASFISGDPNYLYISDDDTHRMTRITK
jgi:NHL repeat